MQDKLKFIIKLQQFDDDLDLIISERKGLPEEIAELEGRVINLTQRIDVRRTREEENKKRKEQLKKGIKESQDKIKKYKTAQAQARNNKEYDNITKQIELEEASIKTSEAETRRIEDIEDKQSMSEAKGRELMKAGREEDLTDDMMPTDELDRQLIEIDLEAKDKKKELAKIIKETQEEETDLIDKIAKHIKAVPKEAKEILGRYQHLRKGRVLNSVVKLSRNACSGCNTRVPTNRIAFIMQGGFYTCETCGRILVAEIIFDEMKVAATAQ